MTMLMRFEPWPARRRAEVKWGDFRDERLLGGSFVPATDVLEDSDGLSIKLDLAGVDPKDVDIRIEDGVLTVKGERKPERSLEAKSAYRLERSHGAFSRSFSLPSSVDHETIKAEARFGVLSIRLEKKVAAKPRSIPVSVN